MGGWFDWRRPICPGIPRSHRYARSRPLTLREGGVMVPILAAVWLVLAVGFAGGAHDVADAGH